MEICFESSFMGMSITAKRFVLAVAILWVSQWTGGCALIERWTGHSPARNSPQTLPPSTVPEPADSSITENVQKPDIPDQVEQIRKQADETVAIVQKQANDLSAEVVRLQSELDAKEQKVQSLNASFQKQAMVVIPPSAPLQYNPVYKIDGVAVLPRDGDTIRIAVDDAILFGPNATQLLSGADEVLNTIIKEIRVNYPNNTIGIEGHADPVLDNPQNPMQAIELTSRKANAIALHLLDKKKVTTKQIKVTGYGTSQPLPGASAEKNNRTEFVIYP